MKETSSSSSENLADRLPQINYYVKRLLLLLTEVVVVIIIFTPSQCAAQTANISTSCNVKVELLPRLNTLTIQTGRLETGNVKCYSLFAKKGEFLHTSLNIDTGYARMRVFKPGENKPLMESWVYAYEGTPTGFPLAFKAPVSGLYVIEAAGWENHGTSFTMQLDEVVPAKIYSKHNKAISIDSRTEWLRNNAVAIRSIDPDDKDFSDLEFLHDQLQGVRVVLLGESDHGNGSDFNAKTRLIKFLHQEMGFDVLAMESGIFGTSVAWRALSNQAVPKDAFLQGVFPVWGLSQQVQPLIRYLAVSAQTDHPLELTGFDCQFREPAARDSLVPSLHEFLNRSGIKTLLSDTNSRQSHILDWAIGKHILPGDEPLPQSTEKDAFLLILKATADAVERSVTTREGQFWTQVLRSVSAQISLYYYWNSPATAQSYNDEIRDRQMGENLVWLSNKYYPGHKIIVWAHTGHTMRNQHQAKVDDLRKLHMGQHVWEVLGNESFVIAMTSYSGMAECITCRGGMAGQVQDIMSDQDPSFEFEELMNAVGYKFGFVNLRKAREEGQWPGGSFAARPLFQTYIAPWSEMMDAFLFIQTQEPSMKVSDIR